MEQELEMPTRLRRVFLASGLLLPPLALVLLSGCGLAGQPAAATSATATLQPTTAATPLPTTTVAPSACGKNFPPSAALSPAGGLVVTQYSGLGNLAYPSVQIPSSQPAAPMPEPALLGTTYYAPNTVPVVDPNLHEGGGGYVLAICNPSGQAHTISAVQVTIAKMTPFTDQLNAWEPCNGGYNPVYKSGTGGCGGADFENEYLHAAFAADATVGATVTATQTGTNLSDMSNDVNLGPLPVTMQPGQAMTIEVGVTPPSAAGYYTFSFALIGDGASTGIVAYSLMTLLAPVARNWSGAACETSAMQALIAQEPTPTPNTRYLCPAT
jgi:hypothetical protein